MDDEDEGLNLDDVGESHAAGGQSAMQCSPGGSPDSQAVVHMEHLQHSKVHAEEDRQSWKPSDMTHDDTFTAG